MGTVLIAQQQADLDLVRKLLHNHRPSGLRMDEAAVHHILVPGNTGDPRLHFEAVAEKFLSWLATYKRVTVILPSVRPMKLNPLLNLGLESLVAMLILAFPEVRWLFGTVRGYVGADGADGQRVCDDLNLFRDAHGLRNYSYPDRNDLFDGGGLRDWVRRRARENELSRVDASHLPARTQCAVALDDEAAYAHLHAYVAYRFGFRGLAVNSEGLAARLLGGQSPDPDTTRLKLVFEDIYINFPCGMKGASKLYKDADALPSEGQGRAIVWPRLEEASYRIFVTSGQRVAGDDRKQKLNDQYLDEQRKAGKHIEIRQKPYAGIFRLWADAGLLEKLPKGLAEDFVWPPPEPGLAESESAHSSPGVLLAIASSLVERAQRMSAEVASVQQAVHGALLSTDALELLGCRTPTLSMEALRLKHHFETLAECQFPGIEHDISPQSRLADIQEVALAIAQWFDVSMQENALLNAKLRVIYDLIGPLREYNRFDEEWVYMSKTREFHTQLWLSKFAISWKRGLLRWILEYYNTLLASPRCFLRVVALWILCLTAAFHLVAVLSKTFPQRAFFQSLGEAVGTFFASGPLTSENSWWIFLAAFSVVVGFAHLGIFLSSLYSRISRK